MSCVPAPFRTRRRAATRIALCGLLATLSGAGATRAQATFDALFDLRFLTANGSSVWLDAGLDKQRYGRDDRPLALGAALFALDATWTPTVSVAATAAAYDTTSAPLHVTEAYVALHPV